MVSVTTTSWELQIELSVIIAAIALLLSFANFGYVLWDRRPRIRPGIEEEEVYGHDPDHGDYPDGHRLWIDIVNHSSRRIKVSHFVLEWKKSWIPQKWRVVSELPDLQKGETEVQSTSRFWIEAWGSVVFSMDSSEFKALQLKRGHGESIRVRVKVRDVLDRWFKSNTVKLA